jgi:hypothetical protein
MPASALVLALGVAVMIGSVLRARYRDPPVQIKGLTKGYWTAHQVTNSSGTYLFDASGATAETEFEFRLLSDPDQAAEARDHLDSLQDMPVVQTEQTNPEADFKQRLNEVESLVETAETQHLRTPVIGNDRAVQSIRSLSNEADRDVLNTEGAQLSMDDAQEQVSQLSEFEEMVDEDQGESALQDITRLSASISDDLTGLQETAVALLNDHVRTAADMFGMKTYNFYCTNCAEDDIDSLLTYEPQQQHWHCDTCRTDFEMGQGIPRHKIRDGLVLDIVDNLWVEKDDEKRRIYEEIEDQKAELEEREFEENQRTIRNATDRIKDLREEVQDLKTEAEAKEGAVDKVGSLMVQYDRLHEERVDEFRENVSEAFSEIDQETQELLEETRQVEQERIEEAQEEAEEKAELLREEERALEREKLAMQQQMMAQQVQAQEEIAEKQAQAQHDIAAKQVQAQHDIAAKQVQAQNQTAKEQTMATLSALQSGKEGVR